MLKQSLGTRDMLFLRKLIKQTNLLLEFRKHNLIDLRPKNGSYFQPGQTIRLEFPAQGYVNPQNTTLIMDVVMNVPTTSLVADGGSASGTLGYAVRFQNNVSHFL